MTWTGSSKLLLSKGKGATGGRWEGSDDQPKRQGDDGNAYAASVSRRPICPHNCLYSQAAWSEPHCTRRLCARRDTDCCTEVRNDRGRLAANRRCSRVFVFRPPIESEPRLHPCGDRARPARPAPDLRCPFIF